MSIPYFPLYVVDFEADTSHLTIAEDGAYNRLLRLCWRTSGCSLPDDDDWIRRKMRATKDEFEAVVRPVLDEFFERKKGRVFSARLVAEFQKANSLSKSRSAAGKKGGRPRKSLEDNETSESKSESKQKPNPKQKKANSEPDIEPEKKETIVSQKGSRLPEEWSLPDEWLDWAISDDGGGVTVELARAEAEKFRDFWHSVSGSKGVKRDWSATWRNWIRKAVENRANLFGHKPPPPKRKPTSSTDLRSIGVVT